MELRRNTNAGLPRVEADRVCAAIRQRQKCPARSVRVLRVPVGRPSRRGGAIAPSRLVVLRERSCRGPARVQNDSLHAIAIAVSAGAATLPRFSGACAELYVGEEPCSLFHTGLLATYGIVMGEECRSVIGAEDSSRGLRSGPDAAREARSPLRRRSVTGTVSFPRSTGGTSRSRPRRRRQIDAATNRGCALPDRR